MIWLRQSTARTIHIGPFVDSGDGNTVEDGLTISQADVRLSKNGGDIAQKNDATSCTHDELGYYTCPLDATDTGTLGHLKLAVHVAGALPVWMDFMVVPSNVWDSMFGSDRLEVDAHEIEGGDATNAIRDALVDDATRIDASALNTLSGHDPGETIMGATDLGTGSGLTALASAADLATVDTVVDGIASDVAALNDLDAGDVQTAAAAALTAYDPPTKAELDAAVSPLATSTEVAKDATVAKEATVAALNDLDAAGVRSAVGLAAANLDTQLAGLPTDADVETACEAGLADYGAAKTTDIPSDYATAAAVTALNDLSAAEAQAAAAAALTAYDPPTRTEATSDKNEVLAAMPEGSDAPTAGEVADAVWDEALVDHAVAGSTGARLAAAAAAGDPWTAELPGDYESGTAGALLPSLQGALTALGAASVTVSNPVADSGIVTLYQGDDYAATHGRSLVFSVADDSHALGLDSATVKLKCAQATWTAASVTSTDDGYTVVFEPTAAETAALTAKQQSYELEATLADGDVVTLATGTIATTRDIPEVS